MKKILSLLFFHVFVSSCLFSQQKDTLVIVVGKTPKEYLKTGSDFSKTLQKALNSVIKTTPKYFFLDNTGIKSEFIKCYFDTSVIKTVADNDSAALMIKGRYTKHQADFLKLNKKPFIDIVGNDAEGKPFAIHDFLEKTTVIGVNNNYIGYFFEQIYKDLDSVKQAFPNVNVVMLNNAMTSEIKQEMKGKPFGFPIVPNCREVLEANVSTNFQLPYYIVLDKNGIVKNMLFVYDSDGFYSFKENYNVYNLQTLQKVKAGFSYFKEIKEMLNKESN